MCSVRGCSMVCVTSRYSYSSDLAQSCVTVEWHRRRRGNWHRVVWQWSGTGGEEGTGTESRISVNCQRDSKSPLLKKMYPSRLKNRTGTVSGNRRTFWNFILDSSEWWAWRSGRSYRSVRGVWLGLKAYDVYICGRAHYRHRLVLHLILQMLN